MTKAERTRQFIVEQTAPLFNCKGFEGTSLSDLTEATGLTKGALYGHFDDKEEMAQEAFRYAIAKVKGQFKDVMRAHSSYKQQLLALAGFYARYVFDPPVPGGCPILNTAIEADDHRHTMRKVVAREITRTVNFIASLIRKGIRAGEFKKNTDARTLAYVFFCSLEGALMYARVERSAQPMEIIVNHIRKTIDHITK